jgi:hypothetical protein
MKSHSVPLHIARTLLVGLACAFSTAHATRFDVTTTADSGKGSLRQAIEDANRTPGADVITFIIPGAGEQRIALASELPAIIEAVRISGYSQAGSTPNSLDEGFNAAVNIFIDGAGIPPNKNPDLNETYGLTFRNNTAGSRVSGVKVSGFTFGIVMANADSITIDGSKVLDNRSAQILVTGNSNLIGQPGAANRNLISGKAEGIVIAGDGNVVRNNYIGFAESITDTQTTNAASNGIKAFFGKIGVKYHSPVVKGPDLICSNAVCALGFQSNNHQIGGVEKGTGNVIIGQALAGVITEGASSGSRQSAVMRVEGNRFGVNFDGKRRPGFGNFFGVFLNHQGPSVNTIQGNTIAEGQVGIAVEGGKGRVPITGAILSRNILVGQAFMAIDLGNDNRDANDALDGDSGDNNKQNFPVLSGGSPSGGGWRLSSAPSQSFTLEFFQSGGSCKNPEAEVFLGAYSVTTDPSGDAVFTGPLGTLPGGFITATATDKFGNTSELSDCVAATKLKSNVSIVDWNTPLLAGAWDARFDIHVGGGNFLFTPTGTVDLFLVSQDPLVPDHWLGSAPLSSGSSLWDQFPIGRTPGILRVRASYSGDTAFDGSTSNVVDVVMYEVKNACTSSTSDILRADFTANQPVPGTYQIVQGSDVSAGNVDNWRPLALAPGKQVVAAGRFDGWFRTSLLARDLAGNMSVEACDKAMLNSFAIAGWQGGNVVEVGRFFKSSQQGIVVATGSTSKRFEARQLPDGFFANMPVIRTDVLRDESNNFTIASLSIAAVGDFDGDGNDDIIWNVDGRLEMWLMNGAVRKSQAVSISPPTNSVNGVPVPFGIAAVGDFDGDGRFDIVWRGGDYYYVAMMDGAALKDPASPIADGSIPAEWKIKAVGDYDGDGKSDLLWRNEASIPGGLFPPGSYVVNYMSGSQATRQSPVRILFPLSTDFIDP